MKTQYLVYRKLGLDCGMVVAETLDQVQKLIAFFEKSQYCVVKVVKEI